MAIAEGNAHIVAALIREEECNANAMDNMFRTPLHWAAALGRTQVVNMLLTPKNVVVAAGAGGGGDHGGGGGGKGGVVGGGGHISFSSGTNGSSSSTTATGVVRTTTTTTTTTGADWSTSDANGATPLHYAAQNNYASTVDAFLSHDAVADIPDLEGRTALMWAACEGADAVVRTMIGAVVDDDDAADVATADLRRQRQRNRVPSDVGATDKTGGTALHVAAFAGKTSTVNLLVELGTPVDGLDLAGHTPLFRACQQGHLMTVQALLEVKARVVDVVDAAGRSPLHWAGLSGHGPIARLLIQHGLSPNHQDHSGRCV